MLKTVRYSGSRRWANSVHCVSTPVIATTIAGPVPSSSSAIRSAAHDTDSVEPLPAGAGSVTFHVDVMQLNASSAANRNGCSIVNGTTPASASAPHTVTNTTYQRAAGVNARASDADGCASALGVDSGCIRLTPTAPQRR